MNSNNYPNETIQLLHERASVRNFSDKKVEPDVLQYILKSGIHAPTAGNLQPYSIIKVEKKETREKLAELCEGQKCIAEAPIDLLFCIDLHRIERWAHLEVAPFTDTSAFRHFWVSFQDTIICAQNICTAADSLGLGSVYIGTVLECFPELRSMFQLPKGVFPVVLLCLGYPQASPSPRNKLGVDVLVHSESYHEMDDRNLIDAFGDKYSHREIPITEERLQTISEVCREVHGESFTKKCIDTIKKNGYINQVQYYFGLHYRANSMPGGNDTYLELMEESGFRWFRKYEPENQK